MNFKTPGLASRRVHSLESIVLVLALVQLGPGTLQGSLRWVLEDIPQSSTDGFKSFKDIRVAHGPSVLRILRKSRAAFVPNFSSCTKLLSRIALNETLASSMTGGLSSGEYGSEYSRFTGFLRM